MPPALDDHISLPSLFSHMSTQVNKSCDPQARLLGLCFFFFFFLSRAETQSDEASACLRFGRESFLSSGHQAVAAGGCILNHKGQARCSPHTPHAASVEKRYLQCSCLKISTVYTREESVLSVSLCIEHFTDAWEEKKNLICLKVLIVCILV